MPPFLASPEPLARRQPQPAVSPTEAAPHQPSLFAASIDFPIDPVQASILDSSARDLILCCTRQWGKSTICAIKALHFALQNPQTTTLIAAPGLRQSSEFLDKAARFLAKLRIPRRSDKVNPRSLLLPNGSRLVALPANAETIRGFSPSLLLIDEAAFVPDSLIHALLPSLAATGGALWLLSTPNGQSGFFYEVWHNTANHQAWTRFKVTAAECPRISREFLDNQRLLLGEQVFMAEYHCEFTPGRGQFFTREMFDNCLDGSVLPLELRNK
jgi:hypothetical protein